MKKLALSFILCLIVGGSAFAQTQTPTVSPFLATAVKINDFRFKYYKSISPEYQEKLRELSNQLLLKGVTCPDFEETDGPPECKMNLPEPLESLLVIK